VCVCVCVCVCVRVCVCACASMIHRADRAVRAVRAGQETVDWQTPIGPWKG
jgi:hypothetical protein